MSDASTDGGAAVTFAESDHDRFTHWLRDRTGGDWAAATEHAFTRQLTAGTLDEDRFAGYLVQDHAFLHALGDLVGHAAGQAPTLDAKAELAEFLVTVAGPENDYFERAFDELGVTESSWRDPDRRPATAAFEDLLGRAAREGGYAESVAALTAVEWVYLAWATSADGRPEQWYYAEWVDLHDNPEFEAFVGFLRDELDRLGPDLAPERQRRVARLFERAVELEVRFFDETGGRA